MSICCHFWVGSSENYLVPLRSAATVAADDVPFEFISVGAVMDLINERKPGFVLVVLDACRSFTNIITSARPDLVQKGAAALRNISGNFVVGFSSDVGKTSIGSSIAGTLSVYTSALAKHLAKDDVDLDTIEKEVHADVLLETQGQQKPWFSLASSVDVRFRPSQERMRQDEEAWRSVLKTDDEKQVKRFLLRYSISRFAQAARKWLVDFRARPRGSYTRISPWAPELAWTQAMGSVPSIEMARAMDSIKLKRIEGPLAFARDAQWSAKVGGEVDFSDVAARAAAFEGRAAAPRPAAVLAKHGEAVATGPLAARERPDEKSKVVASLPTATKVTVFGVEIDRNNETWAKVGVPGGDRTGYISVSPTTVTRTSNIEHRKTAARGQGGRSCGWAQIAGGRQRGYLCSADDRGQEQN